MTLLALEEINEQCIGSSETTRGASVFNFDRALYKTTPKPSTKVKGNKTHFFEWFIGFTEGDGSFGIQKNPRKNLPDSERPIFVINQKNPQVLFTIKKELGFGVIRAIPATETQGAHFRYVVVKLEQIQWLILLFNGNLLLDKKNNRFASWVNAFNTLISQRKGGVGAVDGKVLTPIALKPATTSQSRAKTKVSLASAWLAGFVDAEGGFYASLSKSSRHRGGYRERYKFYIPQKGERWLLVRIGELLKEAARMKVDNKGKITANSLVTPEKKRPDIFRLEVDSFLLLECVIDYLTSYFLLTKQQLVFTRWKRVLLGRDTNKEVALKGEKNMAQYKRKFASLGNIRDVISLDTQEQIQALLEVEPDDQGFDDPGSTESNPG